MTPIQFYSLHPRFSGASLKTEMTVQRRGSVNIPLSELVQDYGHLVSTKLPVDITLVLTKGDAQRVREFRKRLAGARRRTNYWLNKKDHTPATFKRLAAYFTEEEALGLHFGNFVLRRALAVIRKEINVWRKSLSQSLPWVERLGHCVEIALLDNQTIAKGISRAPILHLRRSFSIQPPEPLKRLAKKPR